MALSLPGSPAGRTRTQRPLHRPAPGRLRPRFPPAAELAEPLSEEFPEISFLSLITVVGFFPLPASHVHFQHFLSLPHPSGRS